MAGTTRSGRRLFHLHLDDLRDYPQEIDLGHPQHVLLLALDARGLADELIAEAARQALAAGAIYVSCWGPECERVHDLVDDTDLRRTEYAETELIVVTDYAADETLDEAVWAAVFVAWPAAAWGISEPTTLPLLAVSVANRAWSEQIATSLADPDQLDARAATQ